MKKKTFYITTPIYYPSDKLHIGHSYCTVATDAMARYKRMRGFDVMFLTGTDEHGQKIEEKAAAASVTPQEYVDNVVAGIKKLWELMNISNDRFIRTTDDYHVESVQNIFKDLYDRGDIYKSSYKGKYCTPCESFWTESQLVDGKCPDCGREVKDAEEEAYFFRLSKYADRLMKYYYEENPTFIEPVSRLNEMVNNFIKPGLEDLCVSRTSFTWGIPVTFDPGHIVYVWVDALSNYITALGYGNDRYHDFEKFWPADVHFVGKEITRFHTIIWPAMLMALDLPLPKKVFGHGWLLLEGGKMSKSKGNVVDPVVLCERYGVDAIRYFLLREFPFGSDGVFSNEALITRINADLANDLGNLVSRTLSMGERYFGQILPQDRRFITPDEQLVAMLDNVREQYSALMETFTFQSALAEVFKVISRANKYIDETAPWILGKNPDETDRLAAVIYNLLETIRICTTLLVPFMPETCNKIFTQLGCAEDERTYEKAIYYANTGYCINKKDNLFPRIDLKKELELLEQHTAEKAAKSAPDAKSGCDKKVEEPKIEGIISIDDFMNVKLLVAKITECIPVPKSDKLLQLCLDDGSGTPRQVVSGIHTWYEPEALIGKKVAVVANLKPAKLRGVKSEGMILAADVGDSARVLFIDDAVPCGARIR
ncbi:MAG: methionine--tRNA ligase [Oscillospiraceae bacterium]|nr:methionine--tRNA ligase [Oscillospiraceae bacterium]